MYKSVSILIVDNQYDARVTFYAAHRQHYAVNGYARALSPGLSRAYQWGLLLLESPPPPPAVSPLAEIHAHRRCGHHDLDLDRSV